MKHKDMVRSLLEKGSSHVPVAATPLPPTKVKARKGRRQPARPTIPIGHEAVNGQAPADPVAAPDPTSGLPPFMDQGEASALATLLGLPVGPVNVGGGLWAVVIICTPELAYRWLTEHNPDNRNPSDAQTAKIEHDLKAGHWWLTHQGIAFRADGRLQDGQHRLYAIWDSGVPAWTLVVLNVTDEARMAVDTGNPRSAHDIAKLAGLDIDRNDIAIGRRMVTGLASAHDAYSHQESIEVAQRHLGAIRYARKWFHSRSGIPASAMSAVARAYYHADRVRLDRFCTIVATGADSEGRVEPDDRAALTYKNWINSETRTTVATRGIAKPEDIYARTSRAIRAFLDREPIATLYPAKQEYWPLPENPREGE